MLWMMLLGDLNPKSTDCGPVGLYMYGDAATMCRGGGSVWPQLSPASVDRIDVTELQSPIQLDSLWYSMWVRAYTVLFSGKMNAL